MTSPAAAPPKASARVWLWALGYFACYVPYALLAKAITEGRLSGVPHLSGATLLPVTAGVSAVGMVVFFVASGMLKLAPRRTILGVSVPFPRPATWLSGACTALIVLTTTLAYTFEGTSIVLMMLLMRGGVLALAPLVDRLRGRTIAWYSWVGLVLSAAALLDGLFEAQGGLALAAALDAVVYVAAYFGRLSLMTGLAKGGEDANRRFFVEEQLVATPVAVGLAVGAALVVPGETGANLRAGLDLAALGPALPTLVAIGVLSQGTGIFGALVLLDARENTFSVPVNRGSSVLAGVVATTLLWLVWGGRTPSVGELLGASLVLCAIAVLATGPRLEARRAARAAAPASEARPGG